MVEIMQYKFGTFIDGQKIIMSWINRWLWTWEEISFKTTSKKSFCDLRVDLFIKIQLTNRITYNMNEV